MHPLPSSPRSKAANAISHLPQGLGRRPRLLRGPGYDCSGAVTYPLNGAGFLSAPLDSSGLFGWGEAGAGNWITVYANSGHTYAVVAGLRFDTSGGPGPRWHPDLRDNIGYVARHPSGY